MSAALMAENPVFIPFESVKKRKKIAKIVFDKYTQSIYNIKARLLGGGYYATWTVPDY